MATDPKFVLCPLTPLNTTPVAVSIIFAFNRLPGKRSLYRSQCYCVLHYVLDIVLSASEEFAFNSRATTMTLQVEPLKSAAVKPDVPVVLPAISV